MLIYFHKNKFRYERGQLAPLFIVLLVGLIIMSLVTINLSKVASIKTESSNAADSGALAAGSVMANVFNAVALANSQMEVSYWEFYATVSVLFVIALALLVYAMTMACIESCSAAATMGVFKKRVMAIGVAVTAFSLAQYYFYLSSRKTAKKGRKSAIGIGHKFTFTNSGIGSKIKEGSPPESITDPEKRNYYRDTFKQFLDGIEDALEYTYSWKDGQDRGHSVYSKISIDEVDTFELKVTILPSPAVTGLLIASSLLASAALKSLIVACGFQKCCEAQIENVGCCMGWTAACAAAEATMSGIFPLMAAAWVGLLPGWTFSSSGDSDSMAFIICWIEDIEHNRLVRSDTTQRHEGTDLGLWQTQYPDTKSYSIADFRGKGEIYPPNPRHDASIIATD